MRRYALQSTLAILVVIASREVSGDDSRAALEEKFAKTLTGSVMTGTFSVDGKADPAKPPVDRYEIEKAEKSNGDYWIITAKMKEGKIPVPVQVFWAGDTPVLTLTKATIPGLGTFSTRLLIYEGRYAGTWQHDKVGGHMWGTIAPAKGAEKSATK